MTTDEPSIERSLEGVITEANRAVSTVMHSRGASSSVLGARLLSDLLADNGVECATIGVRLTVMDEVATKGQSQRGKSKSSSKSKKQLGHAITIGRAAGSRDEDISTEGPFPGHVVVVAQSEDHAYLLDPTVFQARKGWGKSLKEPPATNLIMKIDRGDGELLEESSFVEIDGWRYYYVADGETADWTKFADWESGSRHTMKSEIRLKFGAGGHAALDKTPGRNDPCSCGSGRKSKRCCL